MKYLFAGGGTAGHINPALAVAEALTKTDPEAELLFVGRCGGRENDRIRARGYRVREIPVLGLERRLSPKNLRVGITLFRALLAAGRILREEAPSAVLGTGGYVSFPALYVASQRGIPTFLHESNAVPGLAARHLGARCDAVLLGMPESGAAFGKRCHTELVGNPVRAEFCSVSREEARRRLGIPQNRLFLLSFGGSLGSERFNDALLTLLVKSSARKGNVLHLHATGERYYEEICKKYEPFTKENSPCRILPYIEDMPLLMRAADIVISRAGAVTLAEIACAGCAAVLIPSPNVTEDHQYKNARLLSDGGAALLLEEGTLTAQSLIESVERLEKDRGLRLSLMNAVKGFCVPNAAERIAGRLYDAAADNFSRSVH